MTTITLWLLVSISDAAHNRGTAVVIGTFSTQQHCINVREPVKRLAGGSANAECIQATVVKP